MGTRTTGRARVSRVRSVTPRFFLRFSAPPHTGYCSVASPSTFENHLFSLERLLSANGEKNRVYLFASRAGGWGG